MIRSFSFKNFYSFDDEQEISLVTPKPLPMGSVKSSATGEGINTLLVALGPNAAGKTNMLKALMFLQWLVNRSSLSTERTREFPFEIFLGNEGDSTANMDIEVEKAKDGRRYKYEVALTKSKILSEYLFRKDVGGKWKLLLARELAENNEYEVKVHRQTGVRGKDFFDSLRLNASFFTLFKLRQKSELDDFFDLMDFYGNTGTGGRFEGIWEYKQRQRQLELLYDIPEHQKMLSYILSRLDTGVNSLQIIKEEKREKEFNEIHVKIAEMLPSDVGVTFPTPFEVFTRHRYGDKTLDLPFHHESSGTQCLMHLLCDVLRSLLLGEPLVIDELERGLHPLLLPHIVSLYTNRDSNPRNAQLICTCHAIEVLRQVEKEHVLLVEKEDGEKSAAYRLDELPGIRRNDNYVAKYMAGELGAIPVINYPLFSFEQSLEEVLNTCEAE